MAVRPLLLPTSPSSIFRVLIFPFCILNLHPDIAVVMVTMLEYDALVFSAMRDGARGYVLKGASHEELLQTIRAAAGGQVLFDANIASRMMGYFKNLAAVSSKSSGEHDFPELTEREREVLELIAQGVAK